MHPPSLTACHQWPVTHARFPNGGMRTSSNQTWFSIQQHFCQLTFIFAKKNSFCRQDLRTFNFETCFLIPFSSHPTPPTSHHITKKWCEMTKVPFINSYQGELTCRFKCAEIQPAWPGRFVLWIAKNFGRQTWGPVAYCLIGILISWLIIIPKKTWVVCTIPFITYPTRCFLSLLKMLRMLGFFR